MRLEVGSQWNAVASARLCRCGAVAAPARGSGTPGRSCPSAYVSSQNRMRRRVQSSELLSVSGPELVRRSACSGSATAPGHRAVPAVDTPVDRPGREPRRSTQSHVAPRGHAHGRWPWSSRIRPYISRYQLRATSRGAFWRLNAPARGAAFSAPRALCARRVYVRVSVRVDGASLREQDAARSRDSAMNGLMKRRARRNVGEPRPGLAVRGRRHRERFTICR